MIIQVALRVSGASRPTLGTSPSVRRAGLRGFLRQRGRGWLRTLTSLAALYLFVAAINLMGHGLKTVAKEPAGEQLIHTLFSYAAHPLAGLCVGVLVTSLVQSSSFTTTFTVGLVAAGQLQLATAIPIIMGANIGTSVTNILVSLAHVRRRLEFRRSLGGAIVHDFFNVLSALVLLPLEARFKIISGPARAFGNWLGGTAFFSANPKSFNFIKMAVKPLTRSTDWFFSDLLGLSVTAAGILEAALGIVILFVALILLVKMLQGLMKGRLSGLFRRTLFRSQGVAFVVGILTTMAVQSSSVTTSLMIPLVGAGVLKLRQIYPYTLGANIGTTITAILGGLALAAIAAGKGPAVEAAAALGLAVAFGHLLFNIYGICIFWPLRWVPISLANEFARMATRRRVLAVGYILAMFFILPVAIILIINLT